MKRGPEKQITSSDLVLAWLSLSAGFTDVLTFLKLGDLFTSAMTGNVALLAIAIGRGQLIAASRSFAALLGFSFGVAVATWINASWRGPMDVGRGFRRLLLLELVFLLASTALWSASPDPIRGATLYAVVLLSAMSMGVQAAAARSINSSGVSTVVFTTAFIHLMTSAARTLAQSATAPPFFKSAGSHLSTFAAYAGGAAVAGFLVSQHQSAAIWVSMIAVSAALGCSNLDSPLESQGPERGT